MVAVYSVDIDRGSGTRMKMGALEWGCRCKWSRGTEIMDIHG